MWIVWCRGGWIAVLIDLEASRVKRAAGYSAGRLVEIIAGC